MPPEGGHVPDRSARGQQRFSERGSCSLHPSSASRGTLPPHHADPKSPSAVESSLISGLSRAALAPSTFLIEGEQAGDTGSQQVAFHLWAGTPRSACVPHPGGTSPALPTLLGFRELILGA